MNEKVYWIEDLASLEPIYEIDCTNEKRNLLAFPSEDKALDYAMTLAGEYKFSELKIRQNSISWLETYLIDQNFYTNPLHNYFGIIIVDEEDERIIPLNKNIPMYDGLHKLVLANRKLLKSDAGYQVLLNVLTSCFTRDIESSELMVAELLQRQPVVVDFYKYCTPSIRPKILEVGLALTITNESECD
jgi:hypothetical protein